jgi:hypothetical protein
MQLPVEVVEGRKGTDGPGQRYPATSALGLLKRLMMMIRLGPNLDRTQTQITGPYDPLVHRQVDGRLSMRRSPGFPTLPTATVMPAPMHRTAKVELVGRQKSLKKSVTKCHLQGQRNMDECNVFTYINGAQCALYDEPDFPRRNTPLSAERWHFSSLAGF